MSGAGGLGVCTHSIARYIYTDWVGAREDLLGYIYRVYIYTESKHPVKPISSYTILVCFVSRVPPREVTTFVAAHIS